MKFGKNLKKCVCVFGGGVEEEGVHGAAELEKKIVAVVAL